VKTAYLRGLGLWTPGYPTPASWCHDEPDPAARTPEAGFLSGPLRRRATGMTRMAVETMQQATSEAGCDPATTPSVWATAHGEHSTAIRLLGMMQRGEGKLSPTHFHNSVHNTAGGYASIATSNILPSTTLTGGRELVSAALLEAMCLLEASARDVVLVLADEPLLPPFERAGMNAPLALAFCFSSDSRGATAAVSKFRRDTAAPIEYREPFAHLHVSAALPLLEGAVLGKPGTIALEVARKDTQAVWCVDLEILDAKGD
jgi:hypothetical protein